MEQSIFTATKKVLGLDSSYTAFDEDVLLHLNAAFGTLFSLGVLDEPFEVEDEDQTWDDVGLSVAITQLMRTYVYLWVRQKFDPPGTSYAASAQNEQLQEIGWRLYELRDSERIEEAASS